MAFSDAQVQTLARTLGQTPKRRCIEIVPKPNRRCQARNLFEIIDTLQKREGVHFEVRAVREVGRRAQGCSPRISRRNEYP